MTYKGSNWTRGDLGAVPEQDPNVACPACGRTYDFEDYWKPRYVDADGPTPPTSDWECDECRSVTEAERLNESLEAFTR
jgi:hypothetical protein